MSLFVCPVCLMTHLIAIATITSVFDLVLLLGAESSYRSPSLSLSPSRLEVFTVCLFAPSLCLSLSLFLCPSLSDRPPPHSPSRTGRSTASRRRWWYSRINLPQRSSSSWSPAERQTMDAWGNANPEIPHHRRETGNLAVSLIHEPEHSLECALLIKLPLFVRRFTHLRLSSARERHFRIDLKKEWKNEQTNI